MTRPWFTLVLLSWLCCLSGPALGLAALPVRGGSVDEGDVRLIVADHAERSTLWVEWALRVTGDRFLILVPLPAGATLDLGDPAWFAAVEQATAPRVLPPLEVDFEACEAEGGVHDTTSLARGERGWPRVVTTLTDSAELAAFLAAEGMDDTDPVSFADFGDPPALVALDYSAAVGAPTLVQLRLEAAIEAGAWLERLQPLGRHASLPVTLTVLAPTPVMPNADAVVLSDDLPTNWRGKRGDSDYLEARAHFLDEHPEAWVTEVVGSTPLFDRYYPDATASVPSVTGGFSERLALRGYTCPDWSAWLDEARARDVSAPVSCGGGELASLDPPACPGDSETASDLACDGIFDLALALSGARLSQAVLTRHVGRLPTAGKVLAATHAPAHTVKVYARAVTESACEDLGMGGTSSGGSSAADAAGGAGGSSEADTASSTGRGSGGYWATTSPTIGSGGEGGGGGGASWTGGSPGYPYSTTPYYPEPELSVEVHADSCDCGGSSDSDCSGDSSSSSSDTSCSGDSSTDTEAGEDTCAGDSSEGSEETCSGDGSADVEGETCSGASEGTDATCASGSGDCAMGRWGFPRPRLSVMTVFLAAGVLPWRRRHRRKR